jgi:cytochrome P450
MDLTKRVIEESLRLYPPAWVFERQATAADVIGGFPIEKRAVVGIAPYVLHRNPRYWDNPEGFDPDRFLPSRSEGRSKYVYLPFGGGARTCIGNHFAMMEAQILLAMILREFRLDLDPSHPIVMEPSLTLRPRHGVRVWRRRRA